MTSLYNREKRGSQLDGKQYVFTFLRVSLWTPHLPYKILPDLPSSSSRIPGIPAVAFSLSHSDDHWGGIIAVGMIITQSQQESKQTGTQQEQEEHT